MECPTMTRQQQQHMLDVLADLFGRQYGVKATFTLKEEIDTGESRQAEAQEPSAPDQERP